MMIDDVLLEAPNFEILETRESLSAPASSLNRPSRHECTP